jgi:hypothetical protein
VPRPRVGPSFSVLVAACDRPERGLLSRPSIMCEQYLASFPSRNSRRLPAQRAFSYAFPSHHGKPPLQAVGAVERLADAAAGWIARERHRLRGRCAPARSAYAQGRL